MSEDPGATVQQVRPAPAAAPRPAAMDLTGQSLPVRRRNWLGWGPALLILLSCALLVDLRQLGRALLTLTPGVITGLLLLATADRLLMGYKWARLLRIVGVRTPMPRLIRIFYQANLSGVFLPSHVGGDLLRAWWAVQATGLRYPIFASLVVERVLGLIAAVNACFALLLSDQLHAVVLTQLDRHRGTRARCSSSTSSTPPAPPLPAHAAPWPATSR